MAAAPELASWPHRSPAPGPGSGARLDHTSLADGFAFLLASGLRRIIHEQGTRPEPT
jgi:hypothetical protein